MDQDIIIYARLKGDSCADCGHKPGEIIAMFGSTSLEKILATSGMSPEDAGATDPDSTTPGFYAISFPADETDLAIHPARKIHVGDFSSIDSCHKAVELRMNLYALELHETLCSGQPARPAAPRYADIHPDSLLTHMVTTYVVPLARAIETGSDTYSIRKAFAAFGAGTLVLEDILGLCTALQSQPGNTVLSDAYLSKIVAIKREDYRAAAHYHDAITKQTATA